MNKRLKTHEEKLYFYEKISELRDKGLSYAKIGRKLGYSGCTVAYWCKRGRPLFKVSNLLDSYQQRFDGRKRTRMLVRIRDRFKCQDCGIIRTYDYVKKHNSKCEGLKGRIKLHDVHHLNGLCGKKSRGYDSIEDMGNLITLCHKCHYNRPEHTLKRKFHN